MPINVGDSVGNPGEDLIYSMLASKKREEGHSNAKNNKRKGVTEVER